VTHIKLAGVALSLTCFALLPAVANADPAGSTAATRAGIVMSAAASQAVAAAPAGTCLGDPTMSGCPKVTQIVAGGEATSASSADFGPTASASGPASTTENVAPDAAGQCTVAADTPALGGGKLSGAAREICPSSYS
jgi:hypothetical protein